MKIAIIGSSQCPNVDINQWKAKKEEIITIASQFLDKEIILVSGGSSWSDHLAVELYKECDLINGLILYLPAEMTDSAYKENTHPGRELNRRHRAFCKDLYGPTGAAGKAPFPDGQDASLKVLANIKANEKTKDSVKIVIKPGFLQRNTLIAKDSDVLIAVTIEDKITGGTLDTWTKFGSGKPKYQLVY